MRAHVASRFPALCLALVFGAGSALAAPPESARTARTDGGAGPAFANRAERMVHTFRIRDLLRGIVDDGAVKVPGRPIEGGATGPRAPSSGNGPAAPGGITDWAKFSRFLRMGIEASGGQSYEAATKALRTTLDAVAQVGGLPVGIDLCFRTSRKAADMAPTWEIAYTITARTMRQIADDPQRYAGDGPAFVRTFLSMGREAAAGQSYENAVKTLVLYVDSLAEAPLGAFQPMDALVIRNTKAIAQQVATWERAWNAWTVTFQSLHERLGNHQAKDLLRLSLAWGAGSSYEIATKAMQTVVENLAGANLLDAFDKLALQTAIQQGKQASTWQQAYEILRKVVLEISG